MVEDSVKDLKESGDAEVEEAHISTEELVGNEPPKIPDVELICDGFGFMPSHLQRPRLDKSLFSKSKKSKISKIIHDVEEDEIRSPCHCSSNINIVRRYTWKTKNRMTVQVMSYGATITTVSVPDKKGVPDDVIAGFDTLEEYFQTSNPYFGATLGRYANIIKEATMVVKPSGRLHMLSRNKGSHHFNGGYRGFDKVNWHSYECGDNKVIMSHVSERLDEGYPGTVMAQITFEVTCDNTIKIEMKCTTSEPTIINMSHAPFFNLAGHHTGPESMLEHIFTINADKYTATDDDGLITGEKKVVGGTAYDFRVPRILGNLITKMPMGGYDINYCVTKGTEQDLTFHARVLHPWTGRVMEVYSNQPGMQFYTGNLLPDPSKIVEELPKGSEEEHFPPEESLSEDSEESINETADEEMVEEAQEDGSEGKTSVGYVPLMGKQGTFYKKHGLFCLMPQNYPDAVNNRHFPNSVLNPGEVYVHKIQYKFGILLGKYF